MKSDVEILNQLAQKTTYLHEMTPEESQALKRTLFAMYQDIAALCQQHHLTVMLGGGSALGAVRHQGFIPWDDDLDLLMPRKDYEQLLQLLAADALGADYEYNAPNPHTDCKNVWLKIYRKNTCDMDIYTPADAPFPQGIYIDVFPLDGVPSSRIMQICKGFWANALQFCSIVTFYATYPNAPLRHMMEEQLSSRLRYYFKICLGTILRIIPHRLWVWWFDCWVKDERTNGFIGTPAGRKYYNGEIFPHNVYLPTTSATFEGTTVAIPGQFDAYLTNLYHDYMQLPPVEKRERHFICKFKTDYPN